MTMSGMNITQNPNLDVADLFNKAKGNTNVSNPSVEPTPAVVNKTPLQMMLEKQQSGTIIKNNNDDGPKRGGSMTDERVEAVERTMSEMDELAEKARKVSITRKPTSDIEMAALIDNLDKLDSDDLQRANDVQGANHQNIVKEDDVMGADISADTVIANGDGTIDKSGLFVPRAAADEAREKITKNEPEKRVTPAKESDTVSVTINKEAVKDGDRSVVEFTDEEREKLSTAKKIELITVNTININTGKVRRPDENFLQNYATTAHKAIGTSAIMTFVASRFRATLRGLTFGEYVDLALSTEITEVETLNKKLSVLYSAIINTSVGAFTSYDDFLRNFAFKDVSLGTYGLYIATNPEVLELGLECGVAECKKKFSTAFNPRNLLVTDRLSDRFLEIMEKAGSLDGAMAMNYHNDSSIITKQVIELPGSKIGVEVGLRSCYDMIHVVLPFINDIEAIMNAKHPDDTNKVRQIITYVTNYISAVYFKDEHGEYSIREDNIENIVDVIYNIPITDYEIVSAIIDQSDEDYAYSFGVQNVVCPSCGNKTALVAIDLDQEVFRQFQELGSTRIDKETLPRL